DGERGRLGRTGDVLGGHLVGAPAGMVRILNPAGLVPVVDPAGDAEDVAHRPAPRNGAGDRWPHARRVMLSPCAVLPSAVDHTGEMTKTGGRIAALLSLLQDAGLRFRQRGASLRMTDLTAPARAE